nr:adipocyte plasma membrane-associated protein-like [Penaeus vannamei]XP_027224968.1 adipocyte plasma membrane-associated protein-like [Penaeus vannamei]XP_027224969.1 adipocyte plasma membrane-associated protein-like [Penaeus vannamei]XP_027224971.1 adipocyte plasma membrane-associated protein-like [Penaeus vannamei]XP_027224972.1 adipocyte plasma membrane-associated protein-like [Penaeus vannamei]
MVFSALCHLCTRSILDVAVLLLVLVLLPGIPPHVTYRSYEIDDPRPLEGRLEPNDILDASERILDGKIVGPESVASKSDDEIFVSLHGGKILRIWGKQFDHFKIITSIGPGCDGPWQEKICGRPLGLRFAPDGRLLVADAYLGLFSVDVETGEKERLFDPLEEIDGVAPKLLDDLDIDSEGNIYWSDASISADLSDGIIEMLSDPSGRLIKFDPKTKKNTVLMKNIHFANGVQLSPDHDFVLVCETFQKRVWRYWLQGPKAGASEIFVDRLPGMPDNLRNRNEGGYYVSLVAVKSPEAFDELKFLTKLPWLRKLLLRFVNLAKMVFDTVSKIYPNKFTEDISFKIFNLEPIAQHMASNKTIVVELDAEGNIDGSMQGNSGRLRFISQTNKIGDNIFFGSPYNKYLGRLYVGVPSLEVEGKGVRMVEKDEEKEPEGKKEDEAEEKEGESKMEEQKKEADENEEEKSVKAAEGTKLESREETVAESIPEKEPVRVEEEQPTPKEAEVSSAKEAEEAKKEETTAEPSMQEKEPIKETVSEKGKEKAEQDSVKKEEL